MDIVYVLILLRNIINVLIVIQRKVLKWLNANMPILMMVFGPMENNVIMVINFDQGV